MTDINDIKKRAGITNENYFDLKANSPQRILHTAINELEAIEREENREGKNQTAKKIRNIINGLARAVGFLEK